MLFQSRHIFHDFVSGVIFTILLWKLLHIDRGKAVYVSITTMQFFICANEIRYILATRSYSLMCALHHHHFIIIILQNHLKALNAHVIYILSNVCLRLCLSNLFYAIYDATYSGFYQSTCQYLVISSFVSSALTLPWWCSKIYFLIQRSKE